MTNERNTVLYTGVTARLVIRTYEHRNGTHPHSFTNRYNCTKLVWFQHFDSIELAISEEKRIKGGNRQKKLNLINSLNPRWHDLWDEIKDW